MPAEESPVAVGSDVPETIPFEYECKVDEAWIIPLARRQSLRLYLTPFPYLIAFGLVALGIFVMVLAEPLALFGFVVVGTGVWVLFLPLIMSRSKRIQLPKGFVRGDVVRIGFGDREFVLSDRLATGRIHYSAYRRLTVRRGIVWLRLRGDRVDHPYPSVLFPPHARERFAAAGVEVRDRARRAQVD